MTDDLTPFTFDGRAVRAVLIDGEPWFVAGDVCAVLGYRDAYNGLRRLDDDERGTHQASTPGGPQQVSIVSEAGLYALILGSTLPRAKEFKRWVTHEVLPAIRRTGSYAVPRPELSRREMAAYWLDAEERAEREQIRRAAAEAHVAELEPAAHSWERLAEAAGDYPLREAAQILSRDPRITTGQNRLAGFLREIGWCDHRGQPYQRAVDAGHLVRRVTDYQHPHRDERIPSSQVRITVSGLHLLHRRLGGERPLLLATA